MTSPSAMPAAIHPNGAALSRSASEAVAAEAASSASPKEAISSGEYSRVVITVHSTAANIARPPAQNE